MRKAGVLTIRGKAGEIQEDQETKALKLTAFDTLTNHIVNLNADLFVLSTGMVPSKYSAKLTETLGMSSDSYGFLSEIHGCLKPQETTNMGVYICGCAAGPKNIPSSVSTASAAASKAAILLSKDTIVQELMVAEVENNLCMGCRRCEKVCNYEAIKVNGDAIAEVNGLKCKGCGVCVSSCPARAIDLKYYRDLQFVEEIKGICSTELKYRDEFIDTVELITKESKPLTP
ncbi:MAG: CoB--CoM heterodisulfide reductase iron-sulfur subunit A family protein [Candidatus Lokiarchaeota archaeon]|nr:CoB--CoM heterodisulfide reductase iron-sulfur subunit A family protein [Candidatus Lokiarchaeota archaeon]